MVLVALNLHLLTVILLHLIKKLLWWLALKVVSVIVVVLDYCRSRWHTRYTWHACVEHLAASHWH